MTTITEEAADLSSGIEEGSSTGAPTERPRRFAPRRSRSATLLATPPTPTPEPDEGPAQPVALTLETAPDTSVDAIAEPISPPPSEPAQRPASRTRTARNQRRPAKPTTESDQALAAEPPVVEPGGVDLEAAPDIVPAPASPTPTSRGRRRPGKATSQQAKEKASVQVAGPEGGLPALVAEEAAPPAPVTPAHGRRQGRSRPAKTPPALVAGAPAAVDTEEGLAPSVVDAAPGPDTLEAAAGSAETIDLEPITGEPEPEAAPELDLAPAPDLAGLFDLSAREAAAVGADLDGAELLAKALREMFPPLEGDQVPSRGVAPDDNLPAFDFEAAAAALDAVLDALPETTTGDEAPLESEGTAETEETQRRRSRRGRRGGRGRHRNGLALVPPLETPEPVAQESQPIALPGPVESQPPTDAPAPLAAMAAPASLFTPERPPRAEPHWRDQHPRRNWGRVLPRSTQPAVTMPPPKPSSTRFTPIPQAVPPAAPPAPPTITLPQGAPFTMPDLRTNEPLGPGETRSERLLDVQTRLMAAMLEQQARQIDVLTASVGALYQAIQGLGTGGAGARASLPRTGIFVDAPNVCYAAENARINLDYARMLKYLSRDRQLVHALSYSPIIEDVREGIRYETQRFVAPFLRAGYKLVTKPLKRFSDGSAKGNFDIELALDMLTMAERLDIVVLVSGDSDFESVIEHMQSKGVRVEVVAFASNVSTELVNVADAFIDISQHLEHMRAL